MYDTERNLRPLLSLVGIAVVAMVCVSCSDGGAISSAGNEAGSLREVIPVQAPMQPRPRAAQSQGAASIRAGYIAAAQRDAGDAYRFDEKTAARNVAQGVSLDVVEGTLRVRMGDRWQISLRLAALGRGDDLSEVAAPAVLPPQAHNRVRHRYGDRIQAWHINGPLGIEQGFELRSRPAGNDLLTVVLNVGGATAALAEGGPDVVLRGKNGERVAHYTDLYAFDADGRQLPAHLEATTDTVSLRVNDSLARYPIVIDPLLWVERDNWLASDGAAGDYFGASVAIDGNFAVVGAWGDDDNGSNSGAAYVFERNGNLWMETAKLVAFDGLAGDIFGDAVDISGNRIVVGAPKRADNGTDSGAIYLFERVGGVWTPTFKFLAMDGAANHRYGAAVAISGVHMLAGARRHNFSRGAVYHLIEDQGTWVGETLIASDAGSGDWFGQSVALSGRYAIVGANGDNDNGPNAGAAYTFYRPGLGLNQQQKLLRSDGGAQDNFGYAVDLSGSTAIVGAWADDDNGSDSGTAYVFTRSGTTWSLEQKLLPDDGGSGDGFGSWVAVSGDNAVIGAPGDDDGAGDAGAAYVFSRDLAVWTQQQKLVASDAAANDTLGNPLALSGTTLLVASDQNDDLGNNSGSVYVFPLLDVLSQGAGCTMGQACASGYCVDGVCCDTSCGGATDDCQACSVATGASIDGTCQAIADATICNDNNVCTQADSCLGGQCVGDTPVICVALDACHGVGTCDTTTGQCDDPPLPNGSACDDGDLCTQSDTCELGTCVGADPVVCQAVDPCRAVGVCDASTGLCSSPNQPDDAACDDGDLCTEPDSCQGGACVSTPTVCTAVDECHDAGICDSVAGACSSPAKPDGTTCSLGTCEGGTCQAPSSSSPSSGNGNGGGVGSSDGSGDEAGCGCRIGATPKPRAAPYGLLALGLVVRRRRRRTDGR